MKNVLIVNLRRIGDVYTTGHLLNSLSKNENNAVSLLVFSESENAAMNLKHLKALHVIDRKEIITLKTNKLFSDGFAFEQLFKQLEVIKAQKWDEIINYSNDQIGAYICSYLKDSAEKIIGVHYNSNRNVVTGSDWEILFNDVLPVVKYAPMHFVDCYHKMIGVAENTAGEKLVTDSKHNATAFSNLNSVRKSLGSLENTSRIIGIQIKTSDASKDMPEEMLIDLLTLIQQNSEFIPIILIGPFEDERRYASELNQKFNQELVIVEADLQAIASVLMNIDILITPDTAIKHIADLAGTPVLEISLGHAPFLKQGTYLAGSLILTDLIVNRNFSSSGAVSKTNIKAQDIISSLMFYFTKKKTIRPILSNDVTLYSCSFDQLGARYSVVAGTVDAQIEIHRLMSRQLINSVYDDNESADIYSDVNDFGITATTNWCTKEKIVVTNVMKDLLGTLRSLIQSQENKKGSRDFVHNLGKLITHAETNALIQIPVTMFKTKIESINAKSFEENAKEVELLLYELKKDIQKVLGCIKKVEENITTQKKEEFMQRSAEASNN